MSFISTNPATGEEIQRFSSFSSEDVERTLGSAQRAFKLHRQTSFPERADRMNRIADLLEDRSREYGRMITSEMGKTLAAAEGEARKCAWVCRFYAENAERFLADDPVETDASRSLVAYQPIGVVLAIMPWNFPFWQVFRFAAPAIMAGNVGLLKHASNVPQCALAIEQLFLDGGFQKGVFQNLFVESSDISSVIADPRVAAVTLTGSVGAGRSVGSAAGKAIKKSVLELGGSDPFIVLADADLDEAVLVALKSRTQNAGQSCIAAKRFIVESGVSDAFAERLVDAMKELTVGDPAESETDIGPLARMDLLEDLEDQIQRSVEKGAKVLTGGRRLDGRGCYFAPTVLAGVRPGMAAFDEETFGPVAAVIEAKDADEAIELANQSVFGLGGAIFTRDVARGEALARRLEVGNAFVNGMVRSDPRLPFGGVKESGYGRELSAQGIREFTNQKTIWIA